MTEQELTVVLWMMEAQVRLSDLLAGDDPDLRATFAAMDDAFFKQALDDLTG